MPWGGGGGADFDSNNCVALVFYFIMCVHTMQTILDVHFLEDNLSGPS